VVADEPPSLVVEDAGVALPFYALPAAATDAEESDAHADEHALATPVPGAKGSDEGESAPGAERAAPPEPVQAAVVVLAKGLSASVLEAVAHGACRSLAGQKPLWRAVDQGLGQLSCELRARGRLPREALVMGTDGRLGATGALPFDLDPTRVVTLVRERALGSVVGDGARALAGVQASWRCAESPAAALAGDPGYAALVLRDERGAIAAGLVAAPAQGRPEGWLSAAVVPGDYLYVEGATAAVVLGPDERLRARGGALRLQQQAETMAAELSREVPIIDGAEQLVWLDRARVGSSNPQVVQLAWLRGQAPEVCRTAAQPLPNDASETQLRPALRDLPRAAPNAAADDANETRVRPARARPEESSAEPAEPEGSRPAQAEAREEVP
jgi:hypothetical protein